MKSTLVITNAGDSLTAYVVAKDSVSALLYLPTEECLVQSNQRIRGVWLIRNVALDSIALDKKSRENRELLQFLKRNMDK